MALRVWPWLWDPLARDPRIRAQTRQEREGSGRSMKDAETKKWTATQRVTWPVTRNTCNRRQRTRVHTELFVPFRVIFPSFMSPCFLLVSYSQEHMYITSPSPHHALCTAMLLKPCWIVLPQVAWHSPHETRRRKSSCRTRARRTSSKLWIFLVVVPVWIWVLKVRFILIYVVENTSLVQLHGPPSWFASCGWTRRPLPFLQHQQNYHHCHDPTERVTHVGNPIILPSPWRRDDRSKMRLT